MSEKHRQEANRLILERLTAEVEAHPDLRFGQLLANLGVIEYLSRENEDPCNYRPPQVKDPFNEESTATLKRMKRRSLGQR